MSFHDDTVNFRLKWKFRNQIEKIVSRDPRIESEAHFCRIAVIQLIEKKKHFLKSNEK